MALIKTDCALYGGSQYEVWQAGSLDEPDLQAAGCYSSSRQHAGYSPIVRCNSCSLARSLWQDDDGKLTSTYADLEDSLYEAEYENRL